MPRLEHGEGTRGLATQERGSMETITSKALILTFGLLGLGTSFGYFYWYGESI